MDVQSMIQLINNAFRGQKQVSDAEVIEAINRAYKNFCIETWCCTRDVPVMLTSGVTTYSYPAGVFKIRDVRYGYDRIPMLETSTDMLRAYDFRYQESAAGTPTHWFVKDARKFGLFPTPSVDSIVYLDAYVFPAVIDDTDDQLPPLELLTDSPQINESLHLALGYGAIFDIGFGFLGSNPVCNQAARIAQMKWNEIIARERKSRGLIYTSGDKVGIDSDEPNEPVVRDVMR